MALLSLSRRLGVSNPNGESNTMKRSITSPLALASTAELTSAVEEARDEVGASFEMGWLPPSPDGIAMCQDGGVESHEARRTAR